MLVSRYKSFVVMAGALALGACATTGSVKRAQGSADAAMSAAQKAQGSADAAASSASSASDAAAKAQGAADAATSTATGTATDLATANQRLDKLEKKVGYLSKKLAWKKKARSGHKWHPKSAAAAVKPKCKC